MTSWIPVIGIMVVALTACDRTPQKPKTSSVISTGVYSAPLLRNESRDQGGAESERESLRLRGPGVHRHLQTRT
jgi:hypothetical protein